MSSCWSEEDFFTDALKILETNTTEEINHDTPKLDHNFTNGNVIPTKLDRCSMAFSIYRVPSIACASSVIMSWKAPSFLLTLLRRLKIERTQVVNKLKVGSRSFSRGVNRNVHGVTFAHTNQDFKQLQTEQFVF